MDRSTLEKKPLAELREIAATLDLRGYQRMRKADLVSWIMDAGATARNTTEPAPADDAEASREPAGGPAESGADDERSSGARSRESGAENGSAQDADARQGDTRPAEGEQAPPNRGQRDRRRRPRTGSGAGGQQDGFEDAEVREGVLDLLPEGYGFLRVTGYVAGQRDVYVSQSLVRRLDLRRGDLVAGPIRRNKNNDKFPALARVDTVDGEAPVVDPKAPRRPHFRDLTAEFPRERFALDVGDATPLGVRAVDLLAPLGRGQRALVASPPRCGQTTLLRELGEALERAEPEVHVMALLVDSRPEEVTDFARAFGGEVISSAFDRSAEDHTQIAELAIERAKRLVERGRDVVVLLDSLTSLSRAYNIAVPGSGKAVDGTLDVAALYPAKRLFGAARKVVDGGSLTIVATAVTGTGVAVDELVVDELVRAANLEVRLDRNLAIKRFFPAIDVHTSATQREELLRTAEELESATAMRRELAGQDTESALLGLLERLEGSDTGR